MADKITISHLHWVTGRFLIEFPHTPSGVPSSVCVTVAKELDPMRVTYEGRDMNEISPPLWLAFRAYIAEKLIGLALAIAPEDYVPSLAAYAHKRGWLAGVETATKVRGEER